MADLNVSRIKPILARLTRLVKFAARSNPALPLALSGAAIAALVLLGVVVGVGRLFGLTPTPATTVAAGETSSVTTLAVRTAQRRMDRLAGKIATLESRFQRLYSNNRMVSDRLALMESGKSAAGGGVARQPARVVVPARTPAPSQAPVPDPAHVAALESRLKRLQSDNTRLSGRLAMIESDNQITTGSIAKRPSGDAMMKREPVRRQRPAASRKAGFSESSGPALTTADKTISRLVPGDVRRSPGAASRTWFALRLGSYGDLEGLRAIWQRLAQTHGALLDDLEPRSLKGRPVDGVLQFDLIAGPLANAAAAAELCARLKADGSACEIARFTGERLETSQR